MELQTQTSSVIITNHQSPQVILVTCIYSYMVCFQVRLIINVDKTNNILNLGLELLGSTIHSYFTLQGDYQNVEDYNFISRMCEIIKKTIQNH